MPRFVVEFGFEAIAFKDHGVFECAFDNQPAVAEKEQQAVVAECRRHRVHFFLGQSAVHVDTGARRYAHGAVADTHLAVDDVGFGIVPQPFATVAAEVDRAVGVKPGRDIVGILAPGFEYYGLGVAIGFKQHIFIDHEGAAAQRIIGVDGDFCKNVQAVVGGNFDVAVFAARQAVDVEVKFGCCAVFEVDTADPQAFLVSVVNFQNTRGRAQFGKYRIEAERIGGKFQPVVRIGGEAFFLAERKEYRQRQECWKNKFEAVRHAVVE